MLSPEEMLDFHIDDASWHFLQEADGNNKFRYEFLIKKELEFLTIVYKKYIVLKDYKCIQKYKP